MGSIIRAGIHGAGRVRLEHALRNRLPFTTSGSFTGATRDVRRHVLCGFFEPGYLADEDLARFRADKDRIVYVVRSYDTPIAWVLDDGTVYRVNQRFSCTTSRHQSTLYLLGSA